MLRSALLNKLRANKSKNDKTAAKNVTKTSKLKKSFVKPLESAATNTDCGKSKSTSKISSSDRYEFDEEILELESKFRVEIEVVKKAVQGIIALTSTNPKLKTKLFEDDRFPLFLQINSIKVLKDNSRILRIPLKNSIITADDEVCLIVSDFKGIPNKKHEEHLEHYEKLLCNKGVTCIKKIMTFHEFRTEYETFELKRRLVELYDVFLVDGRISGKTVQKCGKIFYKKRKIPTAVKLQASKLKEHIEQTLKKTPLYMHGKSDSFVVQIGHNQMPCYEIVENVFYALKGLDKEFLGGFDNIRNLNLFTCKGLSFPIFTSLKNKNQVTLQNIEKKEKIEEFIGELSTQLNSGVIVKATGEVTLYPLNDDEVENKNMEENQVKTKENLNFQVVAGTKLKKKLCKPELAEKETRQKKVKNEIFTKNTTLSKRKANQKGKEILEKKRKLKKHSVDVENANKTSRKFKQKA